MGGIGFARPAKHPHKFGAYFTLTELTRHQRPLAPPVVAELRIADQYFGAAKERFAAINAGGYCGGTNQLGIDIISHSVMRIIKPAAGPMVRGDRPQTPNDRETTEVPLP